MSQVQTAAVVHAMDERIHDKENAAPMGGDAKQGAVPRVLRSGGAVRTAPTSATTEMAPGQAAEAEPLDEPRTSGQRHLEALAGALGG